MYAANGSFVLNNLVALVLVSNAQMVQLTDDSGGTALNLLLKLCYFTFAFLIKRALTSC